MTICKGIVTTAQIALGLSWSVAFKNLFSLFVVVSGHQMKSYFYLGEFCFNPNRFRFKTLSSELSKKSGPVVPLPPLSASTKSFLKSAVIKPTRP